MVAAYDVAKETFLPEKPRPWPTARASFRGAAFRNWDLHPDGRRVAVLEHEDASVAERTDHVSSSRVLRRAAPARAAPLDGTAEKARTSALRRRRPRASTPRLTVESSVE